MSAYIIPLIEKNTFLLTFDLQGLAVGIFFVDPSSAQADCPNGEDYSPCTCGIYSFENKSFIKCQGTTLDQVASIFRRTTSADFDEFELSLPRDDQAAIFIPADLLNNHRVTDNIFIVLARNDYLLSVDPDAFRSSKNTIQSLSFQNVDMNGFDYQFLSGFNQLKSAELGYLRNVDKANWASFPSLPRLQSLDFYFSTGLNDWTTFPRLARGLSSLYLQVTDIQDEAMNRILNWAAQYSADTLEELWLTENDLTQIPRQLQVPLFSKINVLGVHYQKRGISLIPNGSFHGIFPYYLIASNNGIEKIEQGAFQGT